MTCSPTVAVTDLIFKRGVPCQGVAQSRFRRSQRCQTVRPGCGLMSRPATLLVREVDFLMIYSHPIASDLPRGSKTASDQAKRLCAPAASDSAARRRRRRLEQVWKL